jgi:hypothetical protein
MQPILINGSFFHLQGVGGIQQPWYIKFSNISRTIKMTKTSKLPRYKVLIDHISSLEILDRESNQHVFKHPHEILYTDEYKDYSIEDAARIAFICGQICGSRQMKATAT